MDQKHTLQSLGMQHDLGGYKAIYKASRAGAVTSAIGLLLSIGLAWQFGGIFIVVLSLLAITSFFALRGAYRVRRVQVLVYDNGLIHSNQEGLQTVIRWSDVREVWHRVTVQPSKYGDRVYPYLDIVCAETTLKLVHTLAGVARLGKTIEIETARYLYPEALHLYQLHQPVRFGHLTVTEQGLSYADNKATWSLVWREMGNVAIDEKFGFLTIKEKGKWFRVYHVLVPNIEVFRTLVGSLTKQP